MKIVTITQGALNMDIVSILGITVIGLTFAAAIYKRKTENIEDRIQTTAIRLNTLIEELKTIVNSKNAIERSGEFIDILDDIIECTKILRSSINMTQGIEIKERLLEVKVISEKFKEELETRAEQEVNMANIYVRKLNKTLDLIKTFILF